MTENDRKQRKWVKHAYCTLLNQHTDVQLQECLCSILESPIQLTL